MKYKKSKASIPYSVEVGHMISDQSGPPKTCKLQMQWAACIQSLTCMS